MHCCQDRASNSVRTAHSSALAHCKEGLDRRSPGIGQPLELLSSRECSTFGLSRRIPFHRSIACRGGKYYGPQNALDTTLAWGDILTLTATEVSSDRVPLSQAGMLCAVLVLCWVATATATGDYRYKAASNQMLFGQQQINMILAAINSSVTWIVFVPVALACYASMVSHSLMPKTAFVSSSQPGELPAQLEVLVASLFTISSWRGIYAGLRTYI